MQAIDPSDLVRDIKRWGAELGFGAVGIADIDLSAAEPGMIAWLAAGMHGSMDYMERHGSGLVLSFRQFFSSN